MAQNNTWYKMWGSPYREGKVAVSCARIGNLVNITITSSMRINSGSSESYDAGKWSAETWVADVSGAWGDSYSQTIKTSGTTAKDGKVYSVTDTWSRALNGNVKIFVRFKHPMQSNSDFELSIPTPLPIAPGVPPSCVISPVAPSPGASISISSGISSAGTNAVAGYEIVYSKNGATAVSLGVSNSLTRTLNLTGYVHGDKITVSSRAYCTVNGVNYWSNWRTSESYTIKQPAAGAPYGLSITPLDPVPDESVVLAWLLNGTVTGYNVEVFKNGVLFDSFTQSKKDKIYSLEGWKNKDQICFRVRAYTVSGQSAIYSEWSSKTNQVTVKSKIFTWIVTGSGETPCKVYAITEGKQPIEIISDVIQIIGGGSG